VDETLVTWLREQFDIDEAGADAILSPPPGYYDKGWQADKLREFAARQLAEVEAKRRILDEAVRLMTYDGEFQFLELLAEPYAERPGWREEWRPTRAAA
jgi:hypothetical protein